MAKSRTPSKRYIDVTTRGMDRAMNSIKQLNDGLNDTQKILDKVAGAFQTALIPTAALTTAISGIAVVGLRGTTEMYTLNYQISQFSKQIASALLPIVDAMTTAFNRAWRTIQSMGRAGQIAILTITAGLIGATVVLTACSVGFAILAGFIAAATSAVIVLTGAMAVLDAVQNLVTGGLEDIVGIAVTAGTAIAGILGITASGTMAAIAGAIGAAWGVVLAVSKDLRAALWQVFDAMLEIGQAMWPIVKAFGVIAFLALDVALVKPLINFLNVLTLVLHAVAKLIERLQKIAPIIGQLAALAGVGETRQVTANQTGQESFTQTFNRIQEAILRVEESPIEQNTTALGGLTAAIDRLIDKIPTNAQEAYNTLPKTQEIVEGAPGFIGRAMPFLALFGGGG